MEIRIRLSGQVVQEHEFRAMHPYTGFPYPLTQSIVEDFGGDIVLEGPLANPSRYQYVVRDGVQLIDGMWHTKYSVADMDAAAKATVDANQAEVIRRQRSHKLAGSDWTQVADSPVDKAAWAAYRQGLRDIPTQSGFPWDVTWPQEP